jgi:hypothetical protein
MAMGKNDPLLSIAQSDLMTVIQSFPAIVFTYRRFIDDGK